MALIDRPNFLRVPPFPGSRPMLPISTEPATEIDDAELDQLMARVAQLRVGGSYWGAQRELPEGGYTLLRVRDPRLRGEMLHCCERDPVVVSDETVGAEDPWHLVVGAERVIVDGDDELALVAALADVPVDCVGDGPFDVLCEGSRVALREAFRRSALSDCVDPFTGGRTTCAEAVELAGFWRRLIDSNRDLAAAVGFAGWKRPNVAPLLWSGGQPIRFARKVDGADRSDRIVVWKSRTEPSTLALLDCAGAELIEAEDGFIRSVGLGADCVPPLSIILDRSGIYFDPARPSDLETLIEEGGFSDELLARAKRLRELIVELGISKYGLGHSVLETRRTDQPILLVVGQVDDDRAVLAGGGPGSNIELLQRVRRSNGGAYLVYRPHPDVEAGHRRGAIADEICRGLADEIAPRESISSLIEAADEVHTNTSLAGFEALLRGKSVTTYGVPFYAGWGLSRDLGPVPGRRTARRTIDELVAAALLLYPRYLDPLTRLPCPPEILVRRLADGQSGRGASALVRLRKLQGQFRRKMPVFERAS